MFVYTQPNARPCVFDTFVSLLECLARNKANTYMYFTITAARGRIPTAQDVYYLHLDMRYEALSGQSFFRGFISKTATATGTHKYSEMYHLHCKDSKLHIAPLFPSNIVTINEGGVNVNFVRYTNNEDLASVLDMGAVSIAEWSERVLIEEKIKTDIPDIPAKIPDIEILNDFILNMTRTFA